jgi:hypothetical protein
MRSELRSPAQLIPGRQLDPASGYGAYDNLSGAQRQYSPDSSMD